MLSNKTPYKSFSRALVDGVFLTYHGGEYIPPAPPVIYPAKDITAGQDNPDLLLTVIPRGGGGEKSYTFV